MLNIIIYHVYLVQRLVLLNPFLRLLKKENEKKNEWNDKLMERLAISSMETYTTFFSIW